MKILDTYSFMPGIIDGMNVSLRNDEMHFKFSDDKKKAIIAAFWYVIHPFPKTSWYFR